MLKISWVIINIRDCCSFAEHLGSILQMRFLKHHRSAIFELCQAFEEDCWNQKAIQIVVESIGAVSIVDPDVCWNDVVDSYQT